MSKLSPIESQFTNTDGAEAYERWFAAKVKASLVDDEAAVSHDQVMAEMDGIIRQAEERTAKSD